MREVDNEGICRHCGYDPNQPAGRIALEEGTLLQNGRYQLGAVIGMGGFGITYAAWDFTLSCPVAVKEYFPQNICQRDIHEGDEVMTRQEQEGLFQVGQLRFSREARAHPAAAKADATTGPTTLVDSEASPTPSLPYAGHSSAPFPQHCASTPPRMPSSTAVHGYRARKKPTQCAACTISAPR